MNTQTNEAIQVEETILSNSTPLLMLATEMAAKLDANQETSKFLEGTLEAMDMAKRGPIATLFYVLVPTFGNLEEMQFPRWIDKEGVVNPSILKVTRPNSDGTTRSVNSDFYAELANDVAGGKADQIIIDQCSKALSKDAAIAATAIEPYSKWSNDRLIAEKKAAENRKTNRRRLFRTAARVYYQMVDINRKLPDVECDFEKTDDTTLTKSSYAVYCFDKKTRKSQPFAAGQFVDLDVDKALANGGSLEALIATIKRGTNKKADGRNTQLAAEITSIDKWEEYISAVAGYVGGDDADSKRVGMVLDKASKDNDFALSVGDACFALDAIWSDKAFNDRYMTLSRQRRAAMAAEQTAKAKAGSQAA